MRRTDDHTIREVIFELRDGGEPIGLSFFGDKLDVEEGSLIWPESMATCSTSDDARRHVCDKVLNQRKCLFPGLLSTLFYTRHEDHLPS